MEFTRLLGLLRPAFVVVYVSCSLEARIRGLLAGNGAGRGQVHLFPLLMQFSHGVSRRPVLSHFIFERLHLTQAMLDRIRVVATIIEVFQRSNTRLLGIVIAYLNRDEIFDLKFPDNKAKTPVGEAPE